MLPQLINQRQTSSTLFPGSHGPRASRVRRHLAAEVERPVRVLRPIHRRADPAAILQRAATAELPILNPQQCRPCHQLVRIAVHVIPSELFHVAKFLAVPCSLRTVVVEFLIEK